MDPYKAALGLDQSASIEEIKRAYQKLAKQFHPDMHSHSPNFVRDRATLRFKFVSVAYEGLMDELRSGSSNNGNNNSRADYNSSSGNNNNNNKRGSSRSQSSSDNNSNKRGSRSSSSRSSSRSRSQSSSNNKNNTRSSSSSIYNNYYKGGRFASLVILFHIPIIVGGGIIANVVFKWGLWKLQNPGKSFEDYLESKEKAADEK